jgi:hypothetical protein
MDITNRPPSATTLTAGFQLAAEHDVRIMPDYWAASLTNEIFIGLQGEGENRVKLLVKSDQEYTSPIVKVVQPVTTVPEYLIMTENSIYVVFFQDIRSSVRQIQ